jgi:hypothetical protein
MRMMLKAIVDTDAGNEVFRGGGGLTRTRAQNFFTASNGQTWPMTPIHTYRRPRAEFSFGEQPQYARMRTHEPRWA